MAKQLIILAMATVVIFITGPTGLAAADEKKEAREQPIQEVFQTDLVYPQEKGEVQLTLAPRFHRVGKSNRLILPLRIEYGITDAWQVEFGWELLKHHNPDEGSTALGIGDLEIGTKYSFMNIAEANVHAAVGFGVLFPTGSINKGLTEGYIEYNPSLILAKDFPELHHLQLFTQVGIGLVQRAKRPDNPGDKEPAAHEFTLDVGFFLPFHLLLGDFIFTSELNWGTNRWNNNGEEDQKYYTPGLVWNLPGAWEIGIGAPIGLNRDADDCRIISMLTFEFDTQRRQVKEVKKTVSVHVFEN
jgi:hypothetical protein